MRYKFLLKALVVPLALLCSTGAAKAQAFFDTEYASPYYSAPSYSYSWTPQFSRPAVFDSRIDPTLVRAAKIAEHSAARHSLLLCWRYVKRALVNAGAVSSYPKTAYACQAGSELCSSQGFVRLPVNDPYRAPVGSVLVYSGHGAGHVELRTEHGFASDYRSNRACRYHLLGVFARLNS